MEHSTLSSQSLSIYISPHDPALAQEREALANMVTQTLGAHLSDDPSSSQAYIGLFGQHLIIESVQAFDRAYQAGQFCLFFVQQAEQPAPELSDLLKEVATLLPIRSFGGIHDLCQQALPLLAHFRDDSDPEGWHPPTLPLSDPAWILRQALIGEVAEVLGDYPTVLYGPSGIGKTVFALQAALALRGQFPGGVFWLEHGPALAHESVVRFGPQAAYFELARAHPTGRAALQEGKAFSASDVRAWMSEAPGPLLVIADHAPIEWLRELRSALPMNTPLLITSPEPLNEAGWQNLPLPPLDDSEAFAYLAQLLELPPQLAEEALRPLERIIERLEAHPLSLRLAAGWMARAGGWQAALIYLKRLGDSTAPLQQLAPDLAHSDPLEKSIGLFYNSLSARQKLLFRAASLFPAEVPFSAQALWEVSALSPLESDLDALSPTLFTPDSQARHYYLHEYLASYGASLARHAEELPSYLSHHLAYYEGLASAHLAERRDATMPTPDLRQLRYAFLTASAGSPSRLVTMVLAVGQYLQSIHQHQELAAWIDRTLVLTDQQADLPPTTLRALGDLSARIGHTRAAQTFYERSLLFYYETKSLSGQANTLKALGDLQAAAGEVTAAQEFYDRTLQLYAQIDFQLGRANTLKAMGDLSLKSGDYSTAHIHYTRTLELYEQIDFQLGQAHTLKALGDLAALEGHHMDAKALYEHALDFYREINFHSQQALTLIEMGRIEAKLENPLRALDYHQEALRLYKQIDDGPGQAHTLQLIGDLYSGQSQWIEAQLALEKAVALYQQAKDERHAAQGMVSLSEIYLTNNQAEAALRALIEALRTLHRLDDKEQIQAVRRQLRELARKIGPPFAALWTQVTQADLPDWLKLAPSTAIEQRLIYAVRDFMLAIDLDGSQRILEAYQDILLSDEADEVFTRMLRQYAGQPSATRRVDRYRLLLQRARQVGIHAAFEEARQQRGDSDNQVYRLRQTLDAYDEALHRLRDIPLVYASLQTARAGTLRELAQLPHQNRLLCWEQALTAYDDALAHQQSSPLDYAQTQILRAETLRDLASLPQSNGHALMLQTLEAYTSALQYLHDQAYAHTQLHRADTLYQLAMQTGEPTLERMREALDAYNDTLKYWQEDRTQYARTQSHRARVLYAMAGMPGEAYKERMTEALNAYDEALEYLRDDDPLEYARTQSYRVALLRDMAGLPKEDRTARLYQALAACNEALRFLTQSPTEYAAIQIHRAHLLREIAGLRGEHRLARMRESLATYNEVLTYLDDAPLDYANVQNGRASLLRELAGMQGENPQRRLRESLEAAVDALVILEGMNEGKGHYANAQRMVINTRKDIREQLSEEVFVRWWGEVMGGAPPEWLE
jgi:tetratricopeptide (TPR) repeat protein